MYVCKHKTRLAVYANEETDCQEDTSSPVAHHFIIKLILSLSVQQGWMSRHLDFENVFPNGQLTRPVYAELPKEVCPQALEK